MPLNPTTVASATNPTTIASAIADKHWSTAKDETIFKRVEGQIVLLDDDELYKYAMQKACIEAMHKGIAIAADKLRERGDEMRAVAETVKLGARSDRPHVRGHHVAAYNVEKHDAIVVLWCWHLLLGGTQSLYEFTNPASTTPHG